MCVCKQTPIESINRRKNLKQIHLHTILYTQNKNLGKKSEDKNIDIKTNFKNFRDKSLMSQTVHYVIIVHWIQDNEMLLHSRFRLLFSISFILTEAKRLEFRYLHSVFRTKIVFALFRQKLKGIDISKEVLCNLYNINSFIRTVL